MAVRCQVCRTQLGPMSDTIEPESRIHWMVDLLHEPMSMIGHKLALEPWVCDSCMVYALQVCPGMLVKSSGAMRRSIVDPNLLVRNVLAVWAANIVAVTIIPHGNLEGQAPCGGYHKIEPLTFQRIAAAHFLHYGPVEIRGMLELDRERGLL